MQVPDETTVRKAFVNSTRSRAAAANFPPEWPADADDLVAWEDPKAPQRAYLVPDPDLVGGTIALELRLTGGPPSTRKTMCDLCRTQDAPDGSRLVVAPRAGARGKAGDSVGLYVCTDFGCAQRARAKRKEHQVSVTGRPDTRVPELRERLLAFVERVRA